MKYGLFILVLFFGGCNYAMEWPKEGLKVVGSFNVKPDQVSLGQKHDEGPPQTIDKNASTEKTPVSDAEVQAQVSIYMISGGIALVLIGIGLMVARHYTMGIAIPSWVPRKVMLVGAALVVWGSVPPSYRGWIVGFIIVGGLFWMYYGSKNNNHKLVKGKENGTTPGQRVRGTTGERTRITSPEHVEAGLGGSEEGDRGTPVDGASDGAASSGDAGGEHS